MGKSKLKDEVKKLSKTKIKIIAGAVGQNIAGTMNGIMSGVS